MKTCRPLTPPSPFDDLTKKAWEQVPQKREKVAKIGWGKHQKAWKQEIRRDHNSNSLQHHGHVA